MFLWQLPSSDVLSGIGSTDSLSGVLAVHHFITKKNISNPENLIIGGT